MSLCQEFISRIVREVAGGSVAIVHEWLTNLAGSEKVVRALRRAYPGAPVCTSMRWHREFPDWDPVVTSFLQPLARGPSSHVKVLPLMPLAFRSLSVPAAELTVTSFHTFALHARAPESRAHLVYCHTPPRFLWRRDQLGKTNPAARALSSPIAAAMRPGDRRRARRPTLFVANSRAIRDRVRASYGRDAEVVHPPVEVERFAAARTMEPDDYFLVVSRLVPYKRVDLALKAFAELGWPLKIAGSGRAAAALKRAAGPRVEFLGRVPDAELPALVAGARALVFPGEEDFGLVPVESMAAGTPVVAYGRGGVLDTVQDGRSGVLFDQLSSEALVTALRRVAATDWDRAAISEGVARFSEDRFIAEIRALGAALRA